MQAAFPQAAVASGELAETQPRHFIGVVPNAPHQAPRGLFDRGSSNWPSSSSTTRPLP
jgi:hypothetical protein